MTSVVAVFAALPTLIGLGLALGMNPVLYGSTADTLARGVNVTSRLTALSAGMMTGATVLVVVVHGFNPANLVARVQHRADAVVEDRIIDLVVGIVLLVVAGAFAVWSRSAPRAPAGPEPAPADGDEAGESKSRTGLYVLGATSTVVGFTTLPIAYLTGRTVESASGDVVFRAVLYAVFLAALVAPFVLLAWVWSRFPATTQKVTALYDRALAWDSGVVASAVMMVIGVLSLVLAAIGFR